MYSGGSSARSFTPRSGAGGAPIHGEAQFTPRQFTPRQFEVRPSSLGSRGIASAYGLAPAEAAHGLESFGGHAVSAPTATEVEDSQEALPSSRTPRVPSSLASGGIGKLPDDPLRACFPRGWSGKDRVAFLFNRAPDTSGATMVMKETARRMPGEATPLSTMRDHHNEETLLPRSERQLLWERRKDRVSEYYEVSLRQANIGFRK